ncbi:MAG: hypothetical protein V1895_02425 [Parcubacteria group bacterium]
MITHKDKWKLLVNIGNRLFGPDGDRAFETHKAVHDGRLKLEKADVLSNRMTRRRQQGVSLHPSIQQLVDQGRAHLFEVTLGRYQSGLEYEQALKAAGHKVGDYAHDMLQSVAFRVERKPLVIKLVRVTVAQLSFSQEVNLRVIYGRAVKMGLYRSPAEVGPAYLLEHGRNLRGCVYVGMKPIVRDGFPTVFMVYRNVDGSRLDGGSARPGDRWNLGNQVVFRLRQVEPSGS